MNDQGAQKWSEPQAASQRGAVNAWFKNEAMHFESISHFPGSPPKWQIVISRFVFHQESTKKWFFLMTEAGAKQMHMLGLERTPNLAAAP